MPLRVLSRAVGPSLGLIYAHGNPGSGFPKGCRGRTDQLEEGDKEVSIAPPTVIHGDNMIVRSRAKQEWLVVPFSTYNARFEVRIVLTD